MRLPWQKRRPTLAERVTAALARGGVVIDELTVEVRARRVTLRGAVPSAVVRERAAELVRAVPGVGDVDNRLTTVPPAEARAPELAPAFRDRVYVAQPGDTLPDIAERLYGRRSRWRQLLSLNRGVVGDPAVLQPGLRLRLPDD